MILKNDLFIPFLQNLPIIIIFLAKYTVAYMYNLIHSENFELSDEIK